MCGPEGDTMIRHHVSDLVIWHLLFLRENLSGVVCSSPIAEMRWHPQGQQCTAWGERWMRNYELGLLILIDMPVVQLALWHDTYPLSMSFPSPLLLFSTPLSQQVPMLCCPAQLDKFNGNFWFDDSFVPVMDSITTGAYIDGAFGVPAHIHTFCLCGTISYSIYLLSDRPTLLELCAHYRCKSLPMGYDRLILTISHFHTEQSQ